MGACTSKQDSVSAADRTGPSSVLKQLSGLYLNRERRCLHQIRGSSIRTLEFEGNTMKLREDSAIGYLDDRSMMMAGGSTSGGDLTMEVLILDAWTKQIKRMNDLPLAVKGGSLLKYSNYVYLVGATQKKKKPCPLMRYSLADHQWETFEIEGATDFAKLVKGGYFLIGSKLYIVAGKRINSAGNSVNSKKIFYVDLAEDNLQVRQESARFPIKATDLTCMSYKREAITIGGKSQIVFRLMFGDEIEIHQIGSLPFNKVDNFPGIFESQNKIIVFAFPKIAMCVNNEWSEFNAAVHYKSKRSSMMLCSGKTSRRDALAEDRKSLPNPKRMKSSSSERDDYERKNSADEITKRGEKTKKEETRRGDEVEETKKGDEIEETKKGDEIEETKKGDEVEEEIVEANKEEIEETKRGDEIEIDGNPADIEGNEELIENKDVDVQPKEAVIEKNEPVIEHENIKHLEEVIEKKDDIPVKEVEAIKVEQEFKIPEANTQSAQISNKDTSSPLKQQIVPKKFRDSSSSSENNKRPKKTPSVTIRVADKKNISKKRKNKKKNPSKNSKKSPALKGPPSRFSSRLESISSISQIHKEVPGEYERSGIILDTSKCNEVVPAQKEERKLEAKELESSGQFFSKQTSKDNLELPEHSIELESREFNSETENLGDAEDDRNEPSHNPDIIRFKSNEGVLEFKPPGPVQESLNYYPSEEIQNPEIEAPSVEIPAGLELAAQHEVEFSAEEAIKSEVEAPVLDNVNTDDQNSKEEPSFEFYAPVKFGNEDPLKLEENTEIDAPAKLEEKIEAPVKLEEKIEAPVKLDEEIEVEAPVKLEEKTEVEAPVKLEEKIEIEAPVKLEEKIEAPVKLEEKIEIEAPVKLEEKIEAPVKLEEKIEIEAPVKLEEKIEAPVKLEEKTEIEAPVKLEEKIEVEAPVKLEEKTEIEAPVKLEENTEIEAPVKLEEKIEVEAPVKLEEKIEIEAPAKLEKEIDLDAPETLDAKIETDAQAEVELEIDSLKKSKEMLASEAPLLEEEIVVELPVDEETQANQEVLEELEERIENPDDLQKSIEVSQTLEKEEDKKIPAKLAKMDIKAQSLKIDTNEIKICTGLEDIIPEVASEDLNADDEIDFEDLDGEEPIQESEAIESSIPEGKDSDKKLKSSSSSSSEEDDKMPEPIEKPAFKSGKSKASSSSSSDEKDVPKAVTGLVSKSRTKLKNPSSGSFKHRSGKFKSRSRLRPKKSSNIVGIAANDSAARSKASRKIEIRHAGSSDNSSNKSGRSNSIRGGSSVRSGTDSEISYTGSSDSDFISNTF